MVLALGVLAGCSGGTSSDETSAAADTGGAADAAADPDAASSDDAATSTDAPASDDAAASTDAAPGTDAATSGDAATTTDAAADGGACGCASFGAPAGVGLIGFGLRETSGLAASRKNPGILYGHNDSGDSARILAMDGKGLQLGQIDFDGATAVDWEDMAVGPCGGTTCVFVGDFGDNGESRSNYALYAIEEPALDGKAFATRKIPAKKYPFAYPDGSHNCETLLVHPTTGEIFVVTKKSSIDGAVYKFPSALTPGVTAKLEKVGAAKGTVGNIVTGGDVSPCGDRILLRTDGPGNASLILSYAIAPGKSVADALAGDPASLPPASEAQPEAIAFRHDGRGFYTVSEGSFVQLSFYACK
jgi:hypothetical protein